MKKNTTSADYVIIGAGSAGCALAWRLAEAGCEVLIIEHGGSDGGVLINMPAALSYPMNMPRYDWGYRTEAEVHLGGRRLACPRGKVIGGSSSINGMVFVRGNRQDYDYWAESGAAGWSYADVLPYFMRMENAHGGQVGWRGDSGPLHVTFGRRQNPLYNAFIAAGVETGFSQTADYNGEEQEGFCHLQQTVWRGKRWSAASAYLRPALKLPNVRLQRALARRIVFEKDRARAVEVLINGTVCTIETRKEIILSASSINSPKMLMLSGIGDANELKKLDIPVVSDRQGVGHNLQDHLELYIQRECLQPITLNRKLDLFSKALIGAQWLFLRSGDGATNHFEAGAFLKSADADYPDIQYHFLPAAIRYDGKAAARADGFQAHVGPMRSPSRGSVSLNSNRPEDAPRIVFNYMAADADWRAFRYCIRLTQEIFSQPAMAQFTGKPISPDAVKQSDEELNDFIRQGVESAYHPCGTCRMGAADDNGAVVDSDCRVIGTEGLRVVDSSIFPRIPNGNLNAPSIMVGEKAAAHIIGQKLSPLAS